MIKHLQISFFVFLTSLITFISCDNRQDKVNGEIDLSTAIEHNEPTFFPNLKERFGDDVVAINDVDINSNNEGIVLKAKVILNDEKEEDRTIILSNEEMENIVQRVANEMPVDFNWTSDEEVDIKFSRNDTSRSKTLKIRKTGSKIEKIDDHLFKQEIEETIFEEYGEKVALINSMNVEIENGKAVIKATVTLENGENITHEVVRKSDTSFTTEETDKEIHVKMIQIEEK